MNVLRRLENLESALNRAPADGREPCEVCGAPENAIRFEGLHLMLVPDPLLDRECEACGRAIDPESGKPIVAPMIVKLIRAVEPEPR